MSAYTFVLPRRPAPFDNGWSAVVRLADGREFSIGVRRGKRVIIAFKRRGENVGFKWDGHVIDRSTMRYVFAGHVPKSIGALGLLKAAGLLNSGGAA